MNSLIRPATTSLICCNIEWVAKLGEMGGYVVGRWVAKLGEMGG